MARSLGWLSTFGPLQTFRKAIHMILSSQPTVVVRIEIPDIPPQLHTRLQAHGTEADLQRAARIHFLHYSSVSNTTVMPPNPRTPQSKKPQALSPHFLQLAFSASRALPHLWLSASKTITSSHHAVARLLRLYLI